MSTKVCGTAVSVSQTQRSRSALLALLAGPLALLAGSPGALAQSTGTTAAEGLEEVVVTSRRTRSIAGVTEQTAAKSRVTVTGETILNASAGQTFLDSNQELGLQRSSRQPSCSPTRPPSA